MLALRRSTETDVLVGLFNFTGTEQEVRLDAVEGRYTDLITGESVCCTHRTLAPYQYALCRKE